MDISPRGVVGVGRDQTAASGSRVAVHWRADELSEDALIRDLQEGPREISHEDRRPREISREGRRLREIWRNSSLVVPPARYNVTSRISKELTVVSHCSDFPTDNPRRRVTHPLPGLAGLTSCRPAGRRQHCPPGYLEQSRCDLQAAFPRRTNRMQSAGNICDLQKTHAIRKNHMRTVDKGGAEQATSVL